MVYDATIRTAYRGGLSDEQRANLDQMERLSNPTQWQRGQLAAMRHCADNEQDRQRMQALDAKWRES